MPELLNQKYILNELIGSGGMAHVYKAVSVETGAVVAVKILKDEFANDKELLRRFHREAKATLHLRHENIVRAYDVGETNGVPYIVFEYVEGNTIKDLIEEKGRLNAEEATGLCCQILDALEAAHSAGIIHRDIKPQNIIVNADGIAKLADFGIAREVSASTLTFDGKNVIGSVHYISPEQARGDAVTKASDIYSVGITLYEMLTGDVPFHGETAVATAIMQINDEPEPPQNLEPSVSDALNKIVIKAISKDPALRYSDARSMRMDLLRSLTNPDGSFVSDDSQKTNDKPESEHNTVNHIFIIIAIAVIIPLLVLTAIYAGHRKKENEIDQTIIDTASPEPQRTAMTLESTPDVYRFEDLSLDGICTLRLEEALLLLQKRGADRFFVRSSFDALETEIGIVVDAAVEENTIILTLARGSQGRYKADVSFTVDVPENNTHVIFAYKTASEAGVEYSVILHELYAVKEANVTFSATVFSKDEAARTVYLLLNGEEMRSQNVKFSE